MNVLHNHSLKSLNTFHLDVTSDYFTEVNSVSEMTELISDKSISSLPKIILGGGSNVLFTKNFAGITIKNNIRGVEKIKEDDDYAWIKSELESCN